MRGTVVDAVKFVNFGPATTSLCCLPVSFRSETTALCRSKGTRSALPARRYRGMLLASGLVSGESRLLASQ